MHLYKGIVLGLLIVVGCIPSKRSNTSKNYDVTPVLLHVRSTKQTDSIGFNIVQGIAELLYPRIMTGDIPLWGHSSKEFVLGPTQISKMEKRALSPFVSGTDIFIHEYWKLFKRNFDFSVQGISFTSMGKDGKIIDYGYIDGPDIISLLKSEQIPTNANGPAELTYWDALHSNTFGFNLVQFGANNFRNDPRMSPALKYQALYDKRVFRKFYQLESTKRIIYRVLPPRINSNVENAAFYNSIEKYVNANKQTILNAGGDAYFSHIFLKHWIIDNITVKESWSKYKNIPRQNLDELILFIDNHAIALSSKQLREMDVLVNLQGLEEYLSEKRFDFLLEQINNQEIQPQESEILYEALLHKPWNKIIY